MARGRRTARQVAASRRNLVVARKKRKYVKRAVIVGGAVVVGGALAYRSYDKNQESRQTSHLRKLAHEGLHKGVPKHPEYQEKFVGRTVTQPRRYRNRPKSVQSKTTIAYHRGKTRTGRIINKIDAAVTHPLPHSVVMGTQKVSYKGPLVDGFVHRPRKDYRGTLGVGLRLRSSKGGYRNAYFQLHGNEAFRPRHVPIPNFYGTRSY